MKDDQTIFVKKNSHPKLDCVYFDSEDGNRARNTKVNTFNIDEFQHDVVQISPRDICHRQFAFNIT